ncbi:hypothetical protein Sjap_010287 [Stephania japonica]|uniref:SANT domain-containing protein n=1 Tax=Stephania japonica TaxID=461633 RepID=A0AAP0JA34_9MAGN
MLNVYLLTAKAGAKFQPKAKARVKKQSKPVLTSNLTNATLTEGKADTNVLHPPSPLVAVSTNAECLTNPIDTSNIFESEELVRRAEVSHSEIPISGDERPASALHVNTKDDMDSSHTKLTKSNIHGDLQSTFPGLEEPKAKGNAQPKNKPSPSGTVTNDLPEPSLTGASNSRDIVNGPDIPASSSNGLSVLQCCTSVPRDDSLKDHASQDPISSQVAGDFNLSGDSLIDAGRLNREEAVAFPGSESFGAPDQPDANAGEAIKLNSSNVLHFSGDGRLMASDTEHLEENLASAVPTVDFQDVSTLETSASPPNYTPSEFQDPELLENVAVASDLNATAVDDLADSHVILESSKNEKTRNSKRKCKVATREVGRGVHSRDSEEHPQGNQDENFTIGEGNEAAEPKMKLRKRRNTSSAEFQENGSQVNGDIIEDVTSDSLMDQGLNNSDGDDYDYEEEETPGLKKAPKRSKKPAAKKTVRRSKKAEEAGKSNENPPKKKFSHSTRRNRRQGLENPDDGGGVSKIDESSVKLNYHSYMDKTPKERWSKHDTELFYKGIQQFGTDFAMIQQLFPGRTRHQVKLKYKKEERQHPLKVYDALTSRSKEIHAFQMMSDFGKGGTAALAITFSRNDLPDPNR